MTMKKTMIAGAIGALLALGTGSALAAAPDWSKVEGKDITAFYPGVSPLEWIQKGTEHGGARALKKGETCADCHSDEAADMGKKMASGQKIEPTPIAGKAAFIPVKVQAAHDGENLYLRFSWKQPAASGAARWTTRTRSRSRSCSSPVARLTSPTRAVAGPPATPTRAPCRVPTTRKPST
jgi:hypothetical protein